MYLKHRKGKTNPPTSLLYKLHNLLNKQKCLKQTTWTLLTLEPKFS